MESKTSTWEPQIPLFNCPNRQANLKNGCRISADIWPPGVYSALVGPMKKADDLGILQVSDLSNKSKAVHHIYSIPRIRPSCKHHDLRMDGRGGDLPE